MARSHLSALLRKNMIAMRRSRKTTALQILLPIGLVGLLTLIYTKVEVTDVPVRTHIADRTEVMELSVLPRLLQEYNFTLGVSGPKETVDKFLVGMDTQYPGFSFARAWSVSDEEMIQLETSTGLNLTDLDVPPLRSVITRFDGAAEIDAYVRNVAYGKDIDHKRIYAAISFSDTPPGPNGQWEYDIRMEGTSLIDGHAVINPFVLDQSPQYQLKFSGPLVRTPELPPGFTIPPSLQGNSVDFHVPKCNNPVFDTVFYWPGFLTLQRMVDRYIINKAAPAPKILNAFEELLLFYSSGNTDTQAFQRFGYISLLESIANNTEITKGLFSNATKLKSFVAETSSFIKGSTYAPQKISFLPMPASAYKSNTFFSIIAQVFALFFIIAYLYPVSQLIRGIVIEKETKIREGMAMMGLSEDTLMLSWIITYCTQFVLVAFAITLLLVGVMFSHSSAVLVFLLFAMFGISITFFCVTVATFFSRSKTAALVGLCLFFVSFFPYYSVNNDSTSALVTVLASLLSPVAFGLGVNIIATMEGGGTGITMASFNTVVSSCGTSFAQCVIMMAIDCVLYAFLAWYLDKVWPKEYGVPRPWYFLFTYKYWCGSPSVKTRQQEYDDENAISSSKMPLMAYGSNEISLSAKSVGKSVSSRSLSRNMSDVSISVSGEESDGYHAPDENFEAFTGEQVQQLQANRCISIRGLRKEFDTPDGTKVAVDGLDLTMFESQIYVLLGHNGAGKTTTVSMLSGMLAASRGSASIYGMNVGQNMDEIRTMMGVCPQQNVLFDTLTVKEHLELYAAIKNIPPHSVDQLIRERLADVGLTSKTNALTPNLSGGQKRKVCLAIALIGNSKVVFLDEPTSGMDVFAQRSTWNLLRKSARGRIIILTTHSMEEADMLGDRIGIMAAGRNICEGSPMFLKKRYGVGYCMTMTIEDENSNQSDARCNAINDVVSKHIKEAKLLSAIGAEISFQLPLGSSSGFEAMFKEFDRDKKKLGIESYGVSVTTMEEVFLKSASEAERKMAKQMSSRRLSTERSSELADLQDIAAQHSSSPKADHLYQLDSMSSSQVFVIHFFALFQKRLRYAMRDKKAVMYQIVIPMLALFAAMFLLQAVTEDPIPTDLSTIISQYNPTATNTAYRGTSLLPFQKGGKSISNSLFTQYAAKNHLVRPAEVNASAYWTNINDACHYEASPSFCVNQTKMMPTVERETLFGMSSYLLKLKEKTQASTYAAAWASASDASTNEVSYTVFQNSSAYQGVPAFMNVINQAAAQFLHGSTETTIHTVNRPLVLTAQEASTRNDIGSFVAAMFVVLAFSFIPASFAMFLVRERGTDVKHQQLISGVSIPAYWVSTFLFDCFMYSILLGGAIAVFYGFNVSAFISSDNLAATILLLVSYGTSVASQTYMVTYLFRSPSSAQNIVWFVNVAMVILMIASLVMSQITSTCLYNTVLKEVIYLLFPGFGLGDGLLRLSMLQIQPFLDQTCKSDHPEIYPNFKIDFSLKYNALDWDGVGMHITYMFAETVIYFALTIAIDLALSYPSIRKRFFSCFEKDIQDPPFELDEDVQEEKIRVESSDMQANDDMIQLQGVRKVYRSVDKRGEVCFNSAVKGLSFGVREGECFGFLGVNGAGKSTTLKILSGDILPTSGTARLGGKDILTDQLAVRRLLGYCPQTNAILELLTVREHLELFAKIKGVTGRHVNDVVYDKMSQMDLLEFENKQAGTLSGGNKRKLCVAIALIGGPPIIFLDEPSAGMDPAAKRYMWDLINRISIGSGNSEGGRTTVMLTTHSMEECSALCNRMGIMVDGQMRCIGSEQHLKDRFGNGFQAQFKLFDPSDANVAKLASRMNSVSQNRPAIDEEGGGDQTERFVTTLNFQSVCNQLGKPGRFNLFNIEDPSEAASSTWLLCDTFSKDGRVAVEALARWWLLEDSAALLKQFLDSSFPGAKLVENHGNVYRFVIPRGGNDTPLSHIFGTIERAKKSSKSDSKYVPIQEYSVSQTTLEQIFIGFAQTQEGEVFAKGIVNE